MNSESFEVEGREYVFGEIVAVVWKVWARS